MTSVGRRMGLPEVCRASSKHVIHGYLDIDSVLSPETWEHDQCPVLAPGML